MDELEKKANEVVDNIEPDKELSKIIKEEFNISNRKQITFILEYVRNGGSITKAYQTIYGSHINNHVACTIGGRILKKVDLGRLLDYSGHGFDKIFSAMDKLHDKDPANYMKYQSKLRGLDKQTVELSGEVKVPIINIITNHKKED